MPLMRTSSHTIQFLTTLNFTRVHVEASTHNKEGSRNLLHNLPFLDIWLEWYAINALLLPTHTRTFDFEFYENHEEDGQQIKI
jgi:hypothetical protein